MVKGSEVAALLFCADSGVDAGEAGDGFIGFADESDDEVRG